jgi:hypothetical protein
MPTFKINKKVGNLNNESLNKVIFEDKNKSQRLYTNIDKKVVIDNHNLLFHHDEGWTKITVNNIQEKESWCNWSDMFTSVSEIKPALTGWTDKNESFVLCTYDNDNRILMIHGDNVVDTLDEKLTMTVYQRNSPGTSRFDCTWCYHSKHLCLTSVHDKKEFDSVHQIVSDITDHVYDNGAEPYDWKRFLKMQKNQGGDEEDWIGVFAPFTDDEEEEEDDDDDFDPEEEEEEDIEDDESEEEEFDESEEDTSAEEWDDESDSDEEAEYRPKKRIKHH